jgi:RNA polymerase sigma-70 factor (ECF subfamily)
MTTRSEDRVLFDEWVSGSTEAFTRLYELHNPRIFAFACKMVSDAAVAEDVCHRAWEKLIELRNRRRSVESPIGLLLRTVRNLAIDHLRRQKFSAPLEAAPEPSTEADASDREGIVLECLDRLKPQTREILVLHYYSGYSFEEIAGMMQMRPNAVYTRVSRARADLKVLIERRLAAIEMGGAH